MSLREQARKLGGDDAVKELDRSFDMQRELLKQIEALIQPLYEAAEGKSEREMHLACVTVCEALSEAFAKSVLNLSVKGLQDGKTQYNRPDAMILAVRSISGNVNKAFDTNDAAGVGDLIKLASKKAGSLPDKED